MKAENRYVAKVAGADLAAVIFPADGVRRVLDDPKAVTICKPADLAHLAGLAGEMHRHDNLRKPALGLRDFKLLGQRRDAQIVGPGIDIDEVNLCAAIEGTICRSDKGVGGRPQIVPGAEIERDAGDVQRRGRIGNCDCAPRTTIAGHGMFEPWAGLPLRQPIRAQHVGDCVDVLRRNILTSIWYHCIAVLLNSLISLTLRKWSFLPELYSNPSKTGSPRSPS